MKTSLSTPRFLRTKSVKGLERAMLMNNIKRKSWHQYQIIFDGTYWYAWYQVDLNGSYNQELEDISNQKDA